MIDETKEKIANPKWSRATRLWVTVILLAITGWIFVLSLPLFEALLVSGLLAFLIDPIVRWIMVHLKLNRPKASTLVYAIFLLVIASIPTGFGTLVYGLAKRWFSDFPAAAAELERFLTRPIVLFGYVISPSVVLDDIRALPRQRVGVFTRRFPGCTIWADHQSHVGVAHTGQPVLFPEGWPQT